MPQSISTNTFGVAKWVVSADATQGTHTTIASALTSSSSGDTIFIRTGTYTENLTLKVGVNLSALDGSSNSNVIINGTCTLTGAGTVTISGITLQTNSATFLTVSGSSASIVNLNNCYLSFLNNAGITFSSSSASATINLNYCNGNIGTTGIALFAHSSPGTLNMNYCNITNTGASTTASTASAGFLTIIYSYLESTITTSSTNSCVLRNTHTNTGVLNIVCFTIGGSGANTARASSFSSGSASALSVGGTLNLSCTSIASNNTNSITGGGTLNYSGVSFSNNSLINTTTQVGGIVQGGTFQAPSAGFIGEQIRSFIPIGSPVVISNNSAVNVTSILLTAGIWDITGIVGFSGITTGTNFAMAISTTTGALPNNYGDDTITEPFTSTTNASIVLTCPALRKTFTTTTTVYLVGYAVFTVSASPIVYGRISATRVG